MATAFSDLYSQIRTLLGDTHEIVKRYSHEVLDDQISLAATILDETTIQIDESSGSYFTSNLTLKDKAKVVFKVAESLIVGVPNEFHYKSPVMTVRRKGNSLGLLMYIKETLDSLIGDTCPLNYDTEYEVLLNGATKHRDMISDAQGYDL